MKNAIKTLGLAALIGISCIGCSEDRITKTYNIHGENFESRMGDFAKNHANTKTFYEVHSESKFRDYPCGGLQLLPRAEITEYESGKITADLYYPVK